MNLHRFAILFPLVLLTITPLVGQTIRQRSTTEGISITLQGHVLGWSSDYFQYLDENAGSGLGYGGRIGYGFNQRLELFAQYDHTGMKKDNIDAKSFTFANATGGVRFNFSATTHALRPFAELGYAYRSGKVEQTFVFTANDNLQFKAGALHIGAGLNYFVALPVAITLNGALQVGGKSAIAVNGSDLTDKADVTTFRISAGVVFYLSEL
ncbi:hypothetical protein WBJ53_29135 [Spirosoma sp. SC4-14]|uniref:hypothetical protein n=1 Tax=Spirosoma sp. SC4-14 TaxID=3128900 RepID=UPI0030CB12EF